MFVIIANLGWEIYHVYNNHVNVENRNILSDLREHGEEDKYSVSVFYEISVETVICL